MRAPSTPRSIPFVAGMFLAMCAFVAPAAAACADAPAPGVDWRRCLADRRDLRAADLTGAVLRDASLQRADLTGAKLVNIDGQEVRLVSATLKGADLTGAVLRGSDLSRADFTNAKMQRADLRRARMFNVVLRGADLTGADLTGADLVGADFTGATWTDGTRICAAGSTGACR